LIIRSTASAVGRPWARAVSVALVTARGAHPVGVNKVKRGADVDARSVERHLFGSCPIKSRARQNKDKDVDVNVSEQASDTIN
jgi:hypothetical protein